MSRRRYHFVSCSLVFYSWPATWLIQTAPNNNSLYEKAGYKLVSILHYQQTRLEDMSQSHLVSILHYLQTCLEDMSLSQSHLVSILHYLQTCLEDMSQSHLVSILHYLQTCLEDMYQSQSHLVSILHYLQTCLEDMSLSQCQSYLVSVLQVVSETRHFILQLLYPQRPLRRLLDTTSSITDSRGRLAEAVWHRHH